MSNRKLLTEVERTLKKVDEGIEQYDEFEEKLNASSTQSQKERWEGEMKKEIKRLQRLRDQIKGWQALTEIKDKEPLSESRRKIEILMEKFKTLEKDLKIKAYSKEGLIAASKLDPREKEKQELTGWLAAMVDKLTTLVDACEAELEVSQLNINKKPIGKRSTNTETSKSTRQLELEKNTERHKRYIHHLEILLRKIENEDIQPEDLNDMKDYIEFYVENSDDPDFVEDETIFDRFDKEEEEETELSYREESTASSWVGVSGSSILNSVSVAMGSPEKSNVALPISTAIIASASSAPMPNGLGSTTNPELNTTRSEILTALHPTAASTSKGSSSQLLHSSPAGSSGGSLGGSGFGANTKSNIQSQGQTTSSTGLGKKNSSLHEQPSQPQTILGPVTQGSSSVTGISSSASSLSESGSSTTMNPDNLSAGFGKRWTQPPKIVGNVLATSKRSSASTLNPSTNLGPLPEVPGQSLSTGGAATASTPHEALPSSQSQTLQPSHKSHQQGDLSVLHPGQEIVAHIQNMSFLLDQQSTPLSSTAPSASGVDPIPFLYHSTSFEVDYSPSSQFLGRSAHQNIRPAASNSSTTNIHLPIPSNTSNPVMASTLDSFFIDSVEEKDSSDFLDLEMAAKFSFDNTSLGKPFAFSQSQLIPFHSMLEVPQKRFSHPFMIPESAATLPQFECPSFYEGKLDLDSLFAIFYYLPGTFAQYLAARELKRQSWRFHKKYFTWFQRHEEPKVITEDYEQGTYIYFDYECSWCQRKKSEFTFEYRFLEDAELL